MLSYGVGDIALLSLALSLVIELVVVELSVDGVGDVARSSVALCLAFELVVVERSVDGNLHQRVEEQNESS